MFKFKHGKPGVIALTAAFCLCAFPSTAEAPGAPTEIAPYGQHPALDDNTVELVGIFDWKRRDMARDSFDEVYRQDNLAQLSGMSEFKRILDSNNDFANALVEGAENIARQRGLNVFSNDDRKTIIRSITDRIKNVYRTVQPIVDEYRSNPSKVLSVFESGDIDRLKELYPANIHGRTPVDNAVKIQIR